MPLDEAQIRALLSSDVVAPPCARFLGLGIVDFSVKERWCELFFEARPEMRNPAGNVQGGFVAAMLDDAMGLCATIVSGFEAVVPTLQLSVTFLEPTPMTRLYARAEVLRMSRSTAQMQATLRLQDGTILASATASAVVRAMPASLMEKGR